jgi:hypothetical protein
MLLNAVILCQESAKVREWPKLERTGNLKRLNKMTSEAIQMVAKIQKRVSPPYSWE